MLRRFVHSERMQRVWLSSRSFWWGFSRHIMKKLIRVNSTHRKRFVSRLCRGKSNSLFVVHVDVWCGSCWFWLALSLDVCVHFYLFLFNNLITSNVNYGCTWITRTFERSENYLLIGTKYVNEGMCPDTTLSVKLKKNFLLNNLCVFTKFIHFKKPF